MDSNRYGYQLLHTTGYVHTQVEIVRMAFLSGISIALLQEALLRALYATPPKLHITYT